MTNAASSTDEDRALKERHRAMWALGDYPALATNVVSSLGPALVAACDIGQGDRVLDVAAGSGNAAIPAADQPLETLIEDAVGGECNFDN